MTCSLYAPEKMDQELLSAMSRDGNFTRGFGYPPDIRPVGFEFRYNISPAGFTRTRPAIKSGRVQILYFTRGSPSDIRK
jgi:hypothetical protein